jgi:hypothetical protein
MRWRFRHLKWVSHNLTEFEKMNRVQRATELLELLQSFRYQGWQHIITLNESWFYWEIDWEHQWVPEDNDLRTRTRGGIDHNKMMLTILWHQNCLDLIDAMSKRGELQCTILCQ